MKIALIVILAVAYFSCGNSMPPLFPAPYPYPKQLGSGPSQDVPHPPPLYPYPQ